MTDESSSFSIDEPSFNIDDELEDESFEILKKPHKNIRYRRFKSDRAYKYILRSFRKLLKEMFYKSNLGQNIYRFSDEKLLERV